jgi:hypothetical protein
MNKNRDISFEIIIQNSSWLKLEKKKKEIKAVREINKKLNSCC